MGERPAIAQPVLWACIRKVMPGRLIHEELAHSAKIPSALGGLKFLPLIPQKRHHWFKQESLH